MKLILLIKTIIIIFLLSSTLSATERSADNPFIFDVTFKKVSNFETAFRGRVKGYGYTKLYLKTRDNKGSTKHRLIGQVKLDGEPTGVLFSSRIPTLIDKFQSWQIVAISSMRTN